MNNMTIQQLRRDIESRIAANEAKIEDNQASIGTTLAEAERSGPIGADGERHVTLNQDRRLELLFKDIEHLGAANRRQRARLAQAREVEADEARIDASMGEPSTPTRAGNSAVRNGEVNLSVSNR